MRKYDTPTELDTVVDLNAGALRCAKWDCDWSLPLAPQTTLFVLLAAAKEHNATHTAGVAGGVV